MGLRKQSRPSIPLTGRPWAAGFENHAGAAAPFDNIGYF
jgi:hypothetical protein